MTEQQKLDAGAAALMAIIKAMEDGARDTCTAGDYDTAAKLHQMAGHCRIAYGIGRTILTQGGATVASGGK